MPVFSLDTQPYKRSWRQTKNIARRVYQNHTSSFYCNCRIDFKVHPTHFDKKECLYKPRRIYNSKGNLNVRAHRIEWEHVVPAWEFGHNRICWKTGGRKYCKRNDEKYLQMETDLHNLVPVIGELNADRSNFKYGLIEGEKRKYGACDFEVSFQQRTIEPAPHLRGNIARIYLYMYQRYGLVLSSFQSRQLIEWDKSDPVDTQECQRDKKIAPLQGNHNPFVASSCK